MSFNQAVLKLAKQSPEFRKALQEQLRGKTAAKDSLQDAIEMGLGKVASAMGKFLKSKYPDAFKGFSAPYQGGHMQMKVSSEINNAMEKSRPGDLIVTVEFSGTYPTVEVFASFPKAKQFARKLSFKMSASAEAVAKTLGPAIVRDLDYWVTAVAKAYDMA